MLVACSAAWDAHHSIGAVGADRARFGGARSDGADRARFGGARADRAKNRHSRAGFPKSIVEASRSNPEWKAVDYNNFEVAPTGKWLSTYSSLMPWHVRDVDKTLREAFGAKAPRSITDMTAHIGADSVNFIKVFPGARVTSVEIDPRVAAVLRRNTARMAAALGVGANQFRVETASAEKYLSEHEVMSDMVYFDPPWEGHRDSLQLGDNKLTSIISDVVSRPGVRVVMTKLPRETDLDGFERDVGSKAQRYKIHDARSEKLSYYILAFKGKMEE